VTPSCTKILNKPRPSGLYIYIFLNALSIGYLCNYLPTQHWYKPVLARY
jgi:hypothetical protein